MGLDYQSLEIADFSGGITDYPFEAPLNKYAALNNIVIDPNKKALQRPGSDSLVLGIPQIPLGLVRIHNASVLTETTLFVAAEDHVYYPSGGVWNDLLGVGATPAFSTFSPTTRSAFSGWNRHLFATTNDFAFPIKIFLDGAGTPQVRTAGLPVVPSTFVITPAAAAAATYIYYIVYTYTYQSGTVAFLDISSPGIKQQLNGAAIIDNTLSAIPLINNGLGTAWEITNVKRDIYRTQNGGQIAYKVGTINDNTTTTFHDVVQDATLVNNEIFYMSLGIQPYDQPPLAKYIHIMNGRGYYAYTKDSTGTFPTRVYQSIQDDPDSVPATFFIEVRDDITGISSYANNAIVFGKSKVYRLDNYFDELGRNGIIYEEVSKITGCVSNNSIVQTDQGVFFAGSSGFFYTDGFKLFKVSDSINERYKNLVSDPTRTDQIFGTYDPIFMRVYWTCSSVGGGENNIIFSLDLRQGVRPDSTFTTWSNEGYFAPTALTMLNHQLIRCESGGYVFYHDAILANDPRIDPLVAFVDWGHKAIVYDIRTAHLNFGLPQVRKWVSRILAVVQNLSDLSIQINSCNNDSGVYNPLKEIRFRDLLTWGDPNPIWGDPSYIWFFQGLVEQWRRFPAGGLRCSYKQIQITNAFTIIARSDSFCTIDFDPITFIATLTDLSLSWPTDMLDFSLAMMPSEIPDNPDNYPITLPLVQRISDTQILLSDPLNQVPSYTGYTDIKWYVKGIAKNEVMNFMSMVLYYAALTPSQKAFQSGQADAGENDPE